MTRKFDEAAITDPMPRNGDEESLKTEPPRESFEGLYAQIELVDERRRSDGAKMLQLLSRLEVGVDVLNGFSRAAGPKIDGLAMRLSDVSRDTSSLMHTVTILADQLLAVQKGIGELSEQIGEMLRAIAQNHDRSVSNEVLIRALSDQTDKSVKALWDTASQHRHALETAKEQVEAIKFDELDSITEVRNRVGSVQVGSLIDARLTQAELARKTEALKTIADAHRARRTAVYAAIGSFAAGLILAIVLRWLALGGK